MNARPFHPNMNRTRRRGDVPGWVLIAAAVLLVCATGWVEGASPGAMAALFHTVGVAAIVTVIALAIVAAVVGWVWFLVYCWRRMDGPR